MNRRGGFIEFGAASASKDARLISVCIPTRNRPQFLMELLQSIVTQNYRPIEILISDDSTDEATQKLIDGFEPGDGIEVRYQRNAPPLGQAKNVNELFDSAAGEVLMLIHDDDLLLPGSLRVLRDALMENPGAVAAYGYQRLMADDGADLGDERAAELNRAFARIPEYVGVQADSLTMGMLRQIPNNGWLIRTEAAKAIRYRDAAEIGSACDADFGVRLGLAYPVNGFVLVDRFTSVYRLTSSSIARNGAAGAAEFYRIISALELPPWQEKTRETVLAVLAQDACRQFARLGLRRRALQIWMSRAYGYRKFKPRGVATLLCVLVPALDLCFAKYRGVWQRGVAS